MRYARYIKFVMISRDSFTLPRDQAERIMESPGQFFKVTDPDTGEWTGETINKAHIVDTKPDWGPQDDEIEPHIRSLEDKKLMLSRRDVDARTEIEERIAYLRSGRYDKKALT